MWCQSLHVRDRIRDTSVWRAAERWSIVPHNQHGHPNSTDRHVPTVACDWWVYRCQPVFGSICRGTAYRAAHWTPICRIPVAMAFRRFSIQTIRWVRLANKCNWWDIVAHSRLVRQPSGIPSYCPVWVCRPTSMCLCADVCLAQHRSRDSGTDAWTFRQNSVRDFRQWLAYVCAAIDLFEAQLISTHAFAVWFICLSVLPIHALNSTTSSLRPHLVKSPACMKMSPSGISNLMCGVSECVSLIQTTRTLLSGMTAFGGFVVIFITRCVLTSWRHASVGSFVNSCTSRVICSRRLFTSTRKYDRLWFNQFGIDFKFHSWNTKPISFLISTLVYLFHQRCRMFCTQWHFRMWKCQTNDWFSCRPP